METRRETSITGTGLDGGSSPAARLERAGGHVLRYGLVAILVYLGAFKFTATEAQAIQPLVASSPLLAWLYAGLGVREVAALIGVAELAIGGLVALRPWFPRLAAAGSVAAMGMFATTLSFLATTPGMWSWVESFPLPVPSEAGGFLLKDVFLLGAATWSAGEAWRTASGRP
jgi:uncharacterized membrane protein YkgB